jgi:hypothetical protein
MKFWLLNSAVLSAGAYGTYHYKEAGWDELRLVLSAEPVESRIGYTETALLIERMTGYLPPINRETSIILPGDVAYVVRLRYRVDPSYKGSPSGADLEDWEVARLRRLS